MNLADAKKRLEGEGFVLCANILSSAAIEQFKRITELGGVMVDRRRGGIRRAFDVFPDLRNWFESCGLGGFVRSMTGGDTVFSRAILFDKTEQSNWSVEWHQDTTICVREKHDVAGFGPWSVKENVIHVQPPAWVLERMVTFRCHIDDCDRTNGALRVIPKSHMSRIVDDSSRVIDSEDSSEVICEANAGDVLIMKPLLFHSSGKAAKPSRRRVLHIEMSQIQLPSPLQWASEELQLA